MLIVDDDPVVLSLLRRGFEGAGMEVITAEDGRSGLRQLIDHLLDLDLLITDLRMPDLDGPALVRIVRAEGGEKELPILVLAGAISARDRDLLERLGVNALVEKSAGADHVIERAMQLVAEVRLRRDPAPRNPELADELGRTIAER